MTQSRASKHRSMSLPCVPRASFHRPLPLSFLSILFLLSCSFFTFTSWAACLKLVCFTYRCLQEATRSPWLTCYSPSFCKDASLALSDSLSSFRSSRGHQLQRNPTGIVTKSDFVTCQAISSLQPSSFSFSLFFFSIPQGSPGQGADVLTCQASDRHSQQGESNSQDCP